MGAQHTRRADKPLHFARRAKLMYPFIASTMLISEQEAARFGYHPLGAVAAER